MMPKLIPSALAAALLLAPVAAQAGVTVRFINPDRYSDADIVDAWSREANLAEFRRHFEELGKRYLAPGQSLTIDVVDIDLAGDKRFVRSAAERVRVVTWASPARIELRYALSGRGARAQRGRALVTGDSLQYGSYARFESARFAPEKAMLRDWFKRQFAGAQQ
jgi:hypothetical protein